MRTMYLGCYAPNAVKGLIGGSDRVAAGKELFESVGGRLESVSFMRGEYDVVAIVDVSDQQTSMAVAMAVRASGAFAKLTVLEELDMEPILAKAQEALNVYKPAG